MHQKTSGFPPTVRDQVLKKHGTVPRLIIRILKKKKHFHGGQVNP